MAVTLRWALVEASAVVSAGGTTTAGAVPLAKGAPGVGAAAIQFDAAAAVRQVASPGPDQHDASIKAVARTEAGQGVGVAGRIEAHHQQGRAGGEHGVGGEIEVHRVAQAPVRQGHIRRGDVVQLNEFVARVVWVRIDRTDARSQHEIQRVEPFTL